MQKKRQPWGTWTPLTFPNPGQARPTELHQLTERTPPTWQRRVICIFYRYNTNTKRMQIKTEIQKMQKTYNPGFTELHQLTERTTSTWPRRISCIFYVIQIQYNSNTNTNTKKCNYKNSWPQQSPDQRHQLTPTTWQRRINCIFVSI